MDEEDFYAQERQRMVAEHLLGRDIRDPRVLEAMLDTPRHLFIPPEYRHAAYQDGPLPIGRGQTISQPYIVALMSQLLELNGTEIVLEVGAGSGYQAAVLARLARQVHTIERHAELGAQARRVLGALGLHNVEVHHGDGSLGLPDLAPYQAILVTAAAPRAPQTLLNQLDEGGRLVIPVGSRANQYLERWRRLGGDFEKEILAPVAFVLLRGEYGWKEDA
jgi:protein-L-isoaspartate(D-aspartate) O-methyltransferase